MKRFGLHFSSTLVPSLLIATLTTLANADESKKATAVQPSAATTDKSSAATTDKSNASTTDESSPATAVESNAVIANESSEATPGTPKVKEHPLAWTIGYAKARSEYIQKNIRDYSCRLIKRERINGELQDSQFVQTKVRCERRLDGKLEQPLSVHMQFLAPAKLRGRQVLYIDGENDGKMLVRKGGSMFNYAKLKIDPNGTVARREGNYAITDIGFDKIIERLIERIEHDIKHDPTAANTEVSHFREAKVNDRICTHIRIIHPKQSEGIQYHRASLYVDDELHVPIRLVVYDWPSKEGEKPPLIEEYTYINLKLNVGLTDADFSIQKLDSSSKRSAQSSAKTSR